MMPKGIEGLRSNPKDFIRKVIEQCSQFYANKKRDIKAKQRKLVSKEQAEHVRYFFKVGIYSQLSKGDLLASMKHIKQAYDDLRASTTTGALMSKQALEERRENADIIMIKEKAIAINNFFLFIPCVWLSYYLNCLSHFYMILLKSVSFFS